MMNEAWSSHGGLAKEDEPLQKFVVVRPTPQRPGYNVQAQEFLSIRRWDSPFDGDKSDESFRSASVSDHIIPFRSQSASPSLFAFHNHLKQNGLKDSLPVSMTPALIKKRKDDSLSGKKKHGSYKIWHRNAAAELQAAYNAIYGLPLYGSIAFIGRKLSIGMEDFIENEDVLDVDGIPAELANDRCVMTSIERRFCGKAEIVGEFEIFAGKVFQMEIASAGKDDGDFAKILIDGVEHSQDKRGFNIAFMTEDGNVAVQSFDTHGLPEEADRLAEFISSAPIGAMFFGAIRDDGAKFLGAVGRAALRSIGVRIPQADDAISLAKVVNLLPPDLTRALLTVCAKANAKNCARLLIQSGWDIHTRASHTMNTPLHDAVYQGNAEVAAVLLDAGADPYLENKWGETPENIAQKKLGFTTLEDLILSSDKHVQSVMRSIGV